MKITKQEQLFLKRVALKCAEGETIFNAMQHVLDDDHRIFEKFVTLPDKTRTELVRGFSESVYLAINSRA